MMMNTVFLKFLRAILLLLFHLQLQLLVSNPCTVGTEVKCIERERQALLQLKAVLVDDSGLLSSWGSEEEKRDCCQWERVRCSNKTGHVHMLNLQADLDARLRGKISTSLMELQHLRYLDLSYNDFEFSYLPEFFGSLRNLRYLDVSDSHFAGKMPYQLGSLFHLRFLDISSNSLEGAIPSQLGNLSKLQYLDISWNNLIGPIPYNLSSLQKLFLRRTLAAKEFSTEAHWLSHLTSLTVLDLSFVLNLNNSHNWLQNIGKLQNLKELFLVGCQLSDQNVLFLDPSKSNFSSSLTTLDLSYNSLSTKILKSLGSICTLSTLVLDYVNLSEDFSVILGNLSGCARYTLQELNLGSNQITGLLSDVSKFPSLKSLYLWENQLSGIADGEFSNTCSLSSLDLSGNRFSAELSLITQNLFGCRLTLQQLYLSKNRIVGRLLNLSKFSFLKELSLDDNQLNGTLENFRLPPKLENLAVSSNSIKGGIPKSFGKASSLCFLGISNNSLSDELPMIIHNLFGCARSLQHLDLSLNQIIGTIPDLSKFSSLEVLDLSKNQLNGEIPMNIRFSSQLTLLNIASNSKLKGVITDSHFANMSKLHSLELSFSSLTLTFSPNWVPSFQLHEINLRSVKLGPKFPKWLRTQRAITILDISDSGISDVVPKWFWSLSPRIQILDVSCNNLTDTIPSSSIRYAYVAQIILASNQFEGSIPPFLRSAAFVDLSRNKFSSLGRFACANSSSKTLGILNLSNNNLSGQLPDCWNNLKSLIYLDISGNNLSGKLPSSMGSLVELQLLVLRNNKLSGDLPLSLKYCTNLVMLDVGENRLSGKIPSWIGNSFKQLRMLSLRINHFSGNIPLDLCHLTSLQFLDLSLNNLSGEILNCLNNFTAMRSREILHCPDYFSAMDQSREGCINTYYRQDNLSGGFAEYAFNFFAQLMWKGIQQNFKNTDFLLRGIDLSSNQLIGGIPTEITNLIDLVSLNLSRNNLTGGIPLTIGRLTSLEFLDLSRNHFYGRIPPSLAQIDRLAMLDLSHNQLYGRIPISTQLQSFNASSYEENLDLCGKPLEKECPNEKAAQNPPKIEENGNSIFLRPFYISLPLGFITGFWGIFGAILVNRSWRYAYFRLLNNLTDTIYVMVALNVAKCNRWLNG